MSHAVRIGQTDRIKLSDIRLHRNIVGLERTGFGVLECIPSIMKDEDWNHSQEIIGKYYPETIQYAAVVFALERPLIGSLLKTKLGAKEVYM